MTNAQIIYIETIDLIKKGLLKPEEAELHTYQGWKARGYQVKKGEKAIAKFNIWKCAEKKDKDTGAVEDKKLFIKKSAFFSLNQVEKIQ